MRAFRLGLRMLFGSGRQGFSRLALMSVGGVVGTVALLSLASIPAVYTAQQRVLAAQQPIVDEFSASVPMRIAYVEEFLDGRAMTRIAVSTLYDDMPDGSVPSWIDTYPRPGEMIVSPALNKLLKTDPTVRSRYPQTVIQEIDSATLIAPDQLYVIVGVTAAELPPDTNGVVGAVGFGVGLEEFGGPSFGAVRLIVVGAAIFVVLPMMLLIATTARLSARSRRDRLAALRLLGLSARQTRTVASIEIAGVTLGGALVGTLIWAVLRPVSQVVGVGQLRWFARDVTVPPAQIIAILISLMVGSLVIAHGSVTGAVRSPLVERQPAPPNEITRRRLIPLIVGVLALIVAASWTNPSNFTLWYAAFAIGNVFTAVGLVVAMPTIAVAVGVLLRRGARRPWTQLASRRMTFDPYSITRIATGLFVVILIAAIGQSMLLVLDWATSNDKPTLISPTGVDVIRVETVALDREFFAGLPSVAGVVGSTYIETSDGNIGAVIAGCDDLRTVVSELGDNCDPTLAQPMTKGIDFEIEGLPLGDPVVAVRHYTGDHASQSVASLRVPPDLLPASARPLYDWDLAIEPAADIDTVTDRILAVAPAATIDTGDTIERGRLVSTYRTLVTVATGIALIISAAAVMVALVDRAIERRRTAAELLALGVPSRILRLTEAAWIGVPLLVGLILTITSAILAGTAFLRFDDAAHNLPITDIAAIIAIGLLGSVACTTVATFVTPTQYLASSND